VRRRHSWQLGGAVLHLAFFRSIFILGKPSLSDPAVPDARADAAPAFGDTVPTGT